VQGFQRYIRQVSLLSFRHVSILGSPVHVSTPLPSLLLHDIQTIQRSDSFVSLIKQSAHFRLVTPPCLSLSVFRLECPARSLEPEQLNALNRAFYTRLNARHDVAFTQTDLNGMICIRCAVGAERTEEADILQAFEVLCEEANKTIESWDRERERDGVIGKTLDATIHTNSDQ
jgi:hypothetical protein